MSTAKRSFVFDLNLRENHTGYDVLHTVEQPLGYKTVLSYEKEHSSAATRPILTVQQQTALAAKKKAKAMGLAVKPGQQIAMNAFMMYMSGKTLNLFSISTTSTAIISPISSIFSLSKVFGPLEEGVDLQMPKLLFIGLNLVWLAVGLYKMSSMRLLPTTSADWTGSIVWKEMMETSSIPPVW